MLTVYTTGPQCHKCNLTKRQFDKAGVEYVEVRLDEAPEDVAAAFIAAGHSVAPVVVDKLTNATWSDFRGDLIKAAIEAR
ncbi:NrdH-like glutaredoxin [Mycobacterium phage Hammy]|uniref:NrdH-like glutaredoxin n=2 Tax=Amginevirus TaxID=2946794 RepID=A0A222ZNN9_9CAUD|nr:NrdH-like glutaredoxin [Mycobacterium phage Amohnition]YP_009952024.1 NrdH-like glutaredoxin [Mycobacterium phage DarthP]APD18229.1 NrdH-like glutaredoxin [Mycobacterium phage Hammy]ASR86346.1 NrdH-like glutaredoxin [Mycobacterium phage Amohnition]ASW31812.1 NrdH-like glutaredoxin [Mycobacterium phage DarthP]